MKKITTLILAVLLVLTLGLGLASCASGETASDGVVYKLDKESDTYTVIGYTGTAEALVIPAEFNGKAVTKIADSAFAGNKTITSADINDSVTEIGSLAFSGCSALAEINLSGSLTVIPIGAFADCTALASIELKSGVTKIDYRAFSGCSALAQVTLPASVETIFNYAFSGCSALTDFSGDDSFTVYANAFAGCDSLNSITTPEGDNKGVYSFSDGILFDTDSDGNKTLVSFIRGDASYTLPADITAIRGRAFYRLFTLSAIEVDPANTAYTSVDGVLYSKDMTTLIAYPTNKSGDSFELPSTVTKIAEYAFCGNTLIKKISLNSSLTEIGDSAFRGCKCLEELDKTPTAATVGANAFSDCSALSTMYIYDSAPELQFIGGVLFSKDGTRLVSCPASITEPSYTIPASVTAVDIRAFSFCPSLTAITVAEGNTALRAVDGVLFTADGTELVACPAGKSGAYTLPSDVKTIAEYAFKNCTALTSITLGDKITSIPRAAFENCSSMTSLTIYGAVGSIGDYAFEKCTALTTVNFNVEPSAWNAIKNGTGNEKLAAAKLKPIA